MYQITINTRASDKAKKTDPKVHEWWISLASDSFPEKF